MTSKCSSEKSVGAMRDGDFIKIWVTPGIKETVIFGKAKWLDDETIGITTIMGTISMSVRNILSVTMREGVYDVLYEGSSLKLVPELA